MDKVSGFSLYKCGGGRWGRFRVAQTCGGSMKKPRPVIFTLSEDGCEIESIRLTTGERRVRPGTLPHCKLDAAGRALVESLGWVQVAGPQANLWYCPSYQRDGLVSLARREKARLDREAREKGQRIWQERQAQVRDQGPHSVL